MDTAKQDAWLEQILPKHQNLTRAVIAILENLMKSKDIDYLAISGRTKDKHCALDKIKRKGYKKPASQLTDLSGIRIIVYFESDVKKVCDLIKNSFAVDEANSLNKDDLLSTNQIGYRSIHFVCDLGKKRSTLPEFDGLSDLKFEVQVRTVLQHAWAELAHDRNYKFAGKLPKEVERKMYLYAGMLEIADQGFDELSHQIDTYIDNLRDKTAKGDLTTELNSISLVQFVKEWEKTNGIELEAPYSSRDDNSVLIDELNQFGIKNLAQLNTIVPDRYADILKERKINTTIFGLIRDWMLISDWRRYKRDVKFQWGLGGEKNVFNEYFDADELAEFYENFI